MNKEKLRELSSRELHTLKDMALLDVDETCNLNVKNFLDELIEEILNILEERGDA
ncbi:hypothetical protein PSYJYH_000034 [Bacillus phage PSYJ-YH]|nr:hypothetical protein PSYJYH_000034 [Bacillus phage PSYJ-YH]